MNLAQCNNGHFYDDERFSCCPYCNNTASGELTSDANLSQMELTSDAVDSGFNWSESGSGSSTITEKETKSDIPDNGGETLSSVVDKVKQDDDDEKTTYFENEAGKPVVGWLVCIEGSHFGNDFKLRLGGNFIGRGTNMDVSISGDPSVSRNKHAVVIYEPKNNMFIIQPGESKGLTYLNDKVILSPTEMASNDIIQLGNTKLMFIPCCTDKFTWDSLNA